MAKVTIYTTATCPFCKMEKEYLDSKNIDFEEILVDQNPAKAQEMLEMSGQLGVPFTIIETGENQKIKILGFDKKKINSALEIDS